MITLHDVKVWDTGEVIDLVIPGTAADLLTDADRPFPPAAVQVADGDVHIDATGLTVAPGLADPHVHFRDPGQTAKETMVSGCAAAASGGYTNVLIMPNTVPAMDGENVAVGQPGADEVLAAGHDAVIDFLQHYEADHGVTLPVAYDLCVCASKDRAGKEPTELADIAWYMPGRHTGEKDAAQLAHPVTAVSDDGSAVPDAILDEVLTRIKDAGLYLIEHCEHHDTGFINEGPVSRQLGLPGIPEDTELRIVARDIEAARRTGAHVHFQHVSTAGSFEAIRKAKAECLPITCETAPHYIALTDEAILEYGPLAKMNPPLRSTADRQAVHAAIADGTVDLIATDHAPHTMEEKNAGLEAAPNGIIGLECAYGVCHKVLVDGGIISEQRLIELMATAPMHLMGHTPTDVAGLLNTSSACAAKRTLDLGAVEHPESVNLVILDTDRPWTVEPERFHSKARNTPFGGWQVTGMPLATVIASKLVFSRL